MRIRKLLVWGLVVVAYTLIGNLGLSILGRLAARDIVRLAAGLDRARHDPFMSITQVIAPNAQMLDQFTRLSAYYVAIGIAGAVIVGSLLYRTVVRGCAELSNGARRFGQGDLDHRISYAAKNELGEVATAFNSMASQLASATAEIRKQQELAESLLLNILPQSVAAELKEKGAVDPRYHEDVTILFTDFQGFTRSSEDLAAEELVGALNKYFSEFDEIARKCGLEKLKTIGDSYMCVAGIPERSSSHAVDAVLAGFEMIDAVTRFHAEGLPPWPIRIGVHTGPVVSGVVGIRKFAYDIWGESVNFASRIESSGSPNRINLSESTYRRVKDFFTCESRGKVATKDGREYEMYFATGIIPSLRAADAFAARYRTYFRHELPSPSQLGSGRIVAAGN